MEVEGSLTVSIWDTSTSAATTGTLSRMRLFFAGGCKCDGKAGKRILNIILKKKLNIHKKISYLNEKNW